MVSVLVRLMLLRDMSSLCREEGMVHHAALY